MYFKKMIFVLVLSLSLARCAGIPGKQENISHPTSQNRNMALAAKRGDIEQVRQLISQGVSVNTKSGGKTPLYWASKKNHLGLAKLLLSNGAEINTSVKIGNNPGITALHAATTKGHGEMVKLLISHGADVNAKSNAKGNKGDTPLHFAASMNDLVLAKILIAANADVNVRNRFGKTPLHNAARNSNGIAMAKLLISKGARISTKDNIGILPIDEAGPRYSNNKPMEKLLSRLGGNQITRKFAVKIINVSGLEHKISFFPYNDKDDLLGKSSKELYLAGEEHTLGVNESLHFETHMTGLSVTYNYRSENKKYGKRASWRPGKRRKVEIVFEFRLSDDGYLVRVAERKP